MNLTLFIINFVKRSLQLELYNFADFFKVPSVTKQAFSKARKKLSPIVFTLLNKKLVEEFYTDNTVRTFKGLRLLAIDSSTIKLPNDPSLNNDYGLGQSNKNGNSMPLARISTMYDVLNYICVDALIQDYGASDHNMVIDHMKQLPSTTDFQYSFKDLLIFDRGYPSLGLFFLLNDKKKDFLIRICGDFLQETNVIAQSNERDTIITISAFRKTAKTNRILRYLPNLHREATMQLRMLTYDLSSGQKEYILTTLLDQELFTYEDIFKLYGMRWNTEENYKFYKNIAEIENFSGKSKNAAEQDFHATIFACNMAALLTLEAEDELMEEIKGPLKFKYKINRKMLIGTMKNEIIGVLMSKKNLNTYCEKLKDRIKKNLVPIRPGRSYPRLPKWRNLKVNPSSNRRAL